MCSARYLHPGGSMDNDILGHPDDPDGPLPVLPESGFLTGAWNFTI